MSSEKNETRSDQTKFVKYEPKFTIELDPFVAKHTDTDGSNQTVDGAHYDDAAPNGIVETIKNFFVGVRVTFLRW